MDAATLLAYINTKMNGEATVEATVVAFTDDGDGEGLVFWSRPKWGTTEFIVHRWADTYSDGTPVAFGVSFWSGLYTVERPVAEADFEARGGWAARAALR